MKPETAIIMISGPQGSGKTTIMKELKRRAGESGENCTVHELIFADTIYQIHDFAIKLLESRGIKRDIVKDGKLLQLLGTEWGRQTIDNDIWVKCLRGQIQAIQENHKDGSNLLFLISDCRFRNEFDGIPEAFRVRLEASKEVRRARCSQWRENDTHPSEIDLDGYAAEKKFDLCVNTEAELNDCVGFITDSFEDWLKSR